MTLPASFPLSFSQIRTEYGLGSSLSLRAFIGQPGYPASGPISLSDFLGKSAGSSLAVFISGTPEGYRSGTGSVTTPAAAATATGGTPGYSYAWTRISGDVFTINSPASPSTTFTATVTGGSFKQGVYRCTATDGVAATAFADVTVYAEAYD